MTDQTVGWLRELVAKGGKGVVNNIDARCLGRIADELELLRSRSKDGLREAVEYVVDKFKKDEAQGYHTKDREFAIAILDRALSVSNGARGGESE